MFASTDTCLCVKHLCDTFFICIKSQMRHFISVITASCSRPGPSMSLGRTFPPPHIRLIWTDGQASNHNNSWHDCCVNPSCLARDPSGLDCNYINVVPHADRWLAAARISQDSLAKPPCSTCRANCCSFFPRLLSPDKCEGGLTRRRATPAGVKSAVNYFYKSPVSPLELIYPNGFAQLCTVSERLLK